MLEGGAEGPAGLHLADGPGQLQNQSTGRVGSGSEPGQSVLEVHTHPELLVGREAELLQQNRDVDQVQTQKRVLEVRRAAAHCRQPTNQRQAAGHMTSWRLFI